MRSNAIQQHLLKPDPQLLSQVRDGRGVIDSSRRLRDSSSRGLRRTSPPARTLSLIDVKVRIRAGQGRLRTLSPPGAPRVPRVRAKPLKVW